jgi:glycosyltransferase involved in cell wall biosynthesis
LIHARTLGVAHAAATRLSGEQAVVASWGCAAEVFLAMKRRGGLCVLSYPLAHHAAALGILEQEACSNPDFAPTLAGQTWPGWLVDRWEAEIAMADRILVGSSYVRQTFLEQDVPAEKLVVVPYGVDHRFWTPSLSGSRVKQPLQLLFVGQLSQRKGISSLLEAVEALGPNRVELTAVGRLKGDWSTLSAARRLFRHIGHLPRAELLTIYRQAEVFVLPSLVEGMPLAVLEAMACGLPVLTTPNGAGDVVRDGLDGLILPPGDTGRLIAGLESLEAAPARRLSMGHNARGRALQFSWQRYRQCACDHLRKWLGHSVFREAEWPDDDLRLKHERSLGP